MRIMGVDTSVVPNEDYIILSVSILEDNDVSSINTLEIDYIDNSLGELISNIFNVSNCEYLAMDSSGFNQRLYQAIKSYISEDKLKCKQYNVSDIHCLISGLQQYKVLNKIGMELKFKTDGLGRCKFLSNDDLGYTAFAMTTVYSIGVANNELNKLKLKE